MNVLLQGQEEGSSRGAEGQRERRGGMTGQRQEGQQAGGGGWHGKAHPQPPKYFREISKNLTACKVLEPDFKTGISCS